MSDKTLDFVARTVRTTRDIESGVKALFAHCRKHDKANGAVLGKLERLDFVEDARGLLDQLKDRLHSSKLTKEHTGFYFGLDGLNMRKGKGVEFGASTKFDSRSRGIDWAYACDTYFDELDSPVLSKIYASDIEPAGVIDYALCLGYLGLALRQAFEKIPRRLALGGSKERLIAWGFHDGDLLALGLLTKKGLKLVTQKWLGDTWYRPKLNVIPGVSIGEFFSVHVRDFPWLVQFDEDDSNRQRLSALRRGGQPDNSQQPLILRVTDHDRKNDYFTELCGTPIVSHHAATFFKKHAPDDVQLTPATIVGEKEKYYVLNVLHNPGCSKPGPDGELGEPLITADKTQGRSIFKISRRGLTDYTVVTRALKEAIEREKLTGIGFYDLYSRSGAGSKKRGKE